LDQCSSLYNTPGSVTAPYYAYNHASSVVTGDGCSTTNGSSITGIAFYPGGQYPSAYNGALFFGDHTRSCIWAMMPGAGGNPDPNNSVPFTPAATPVDLKIGPNNDLFYVDLDYGTIHRISYTAGNQAPVARVSATPTSGALPLAVQFDGTASSDPEGGDAGLRLVIRRRRQRNGGDSEPHLFHGRPVQGHPDRHRSRRPDEHRLDHHHRGKRAANSEHAAAGDRPRLQRGAHPIQGR